MSGTLVTKPLAEALEGADIAAPTRPAAIANAAYVDAQIEALRDELSYVAPQITDLTVTPSASEVGASVTLSYTWTVTGSRPLEEQRITIAGVPIDLDPELREYQTTSAYGTAVSATLRVDDGRSPPVSRTVQHSKAYRTWRGPMVTRTPTPQQVAALTDKPLVTGAYSPRTSTIDCTGGRYPVIVLPKALVPTAPAQVLVSGLPFTAFTVEEITMPDAGSGSIPCWLIAFSGLQQGILQVTA